MRAVLLPKAHSADKGLIVAASPRARRQFLYFFGVAAAEHDIVGFKSGAKNFDYVGHMFAPFFISKPLETAGSKIIFEGLTVLVAQVSELHRLDHAVNDHCRAQT